MEAAEFLTARGFRMSHSTLMKDVLARHRHGACIVGEMGTRCDVSALRPPHLGQETPVIRPRSRLTRPTELLSVLIVV
jgi:hypothetical protein